MDQEGLEPQEALALSLPHSHTSPTLLSISSGRRGKNGAGGLGAHLGSSAKCWVALGKSPSRIWSERWKPLGGSLGVCIGKGVLV